MRDRAIYVAHILFAATSQGAEGVTLASAVAVSLGIVIQNIPEGAINFLRRNTKVLWKATRWSTQPSEACPIWYLLRFTTIFA